MSALLTASSPAFDCRQKPLSAEIDRCDAFATVAQLRADREAGLPIDDPLLGRELLLFRPALRRASPSGQCAVAILRILVPVAMHVLDSGRHELHLEPLQLLHIARCLRYQAAVDRKLLGFFQHHALLCCADQNLAFPAALGSARFERGPVAAVGRDRGARAALPEVVEKAAPLRFREWWPGAPMTKGVYDLPVPDGTPVVNPQALLIPPVGFDEHGFRLGYGGGYFDRTLAALHPQPLKIGVAYESSRMPTIRPQLHDVPMDFIVTEAGIHRVGSDGLERSDDPARAAGLAADIVAARGIECFTRTQSD